MDCGLTPHAPRSLYQIAVPRSLAERLGMKRVHPVPDEERAVSVDVGPVWEKMGAIRCHASQHGVTPILKAPPERLRLFLGAETFRLALSHVGQVGEAADSLEELGVPYTRASTHRV